MNNTHLSDSHGREEETFEAPLVSVVDDDELMRRSIWRLLRSFGLQSEAFASAEEFLQSGRMAATGCLLLDVSMPGMDGLALQRRLADTGWMIPIIFLSARASEEEERLAVQAGAVNFLRKPVNQEVLLHAIHAALMRPNNKPGKEQ
ncbi:MAG: response regulator [Verrucomicrobiota bacterium]